MLRRRARAESLLDLLEACDRALEECRDWPGDSSDRVPASHVGDALDEIERYMK